MFKKIILKNFCNIILVSLCGFLISCSHGHCPSKVGDTKGEGGEGFKKAVSKSKTTTVWVYKNDQSKQCYDEAGIALDEMAKELGYLKIKILSKVKAHDELIRTQVCGQYTGRVNVFEIPVSELERVKNLGYQVWEK